MRSEDTICLRGHAAVQLLVLSSLPYVLYGELVRPQITLDCCVLRGYGYSCTRRAVGCSSHMLFGRESASQMP
jgi:hypothetical protein